jgi:hypothetical protein
LGVRLHQPDAYRLNCQNVGAHRRPPHQLLLKHHGATSDALDQIGQLIKSLTNVLTKMKDKTIDISPTFMSYSDQDFEAACQAKKEFLQLTGKDIKLWDIY